MVCIESNQRESQFDTLFKKFRENGSLWNDYYQEARTEPSCYEKNQVTLFPYDSFYVVLYPTLSDNTGFYYI
jgi:hypothetical protein